MSGRRSSWPGIARARKARWKRKTSVFFGYERLLGLLSAKGFLMSADAGGSSEMCRFSEAADALMSAISVSPFGRELPG